MSGSFAEEFDALQGLGPERFAQFTGGLDPEWIAQALAATGKASVRKRKLPAEQAVWLVLGMGLYADRSIVDVVDHLSLVAPGVKRLARSSVPAARYRLGAKPLRELFRLVVNQWAGPRPDLGYRGLSLYAVDGTCVRVQDTDENFEEFGKPGGRAGAGDAGYPQIRMACLMDLGARMLVDAAVGSFATGEQSLAAELWERVPAHSLTILDRSFVNYPVFHGLVGAGDGRHLMVRMRENMKVTEIETLDDGTLLADLAPSRKTSADHPHVKGTVIRGRVVAYQHEGGRPSRLFTTLTDPVEHPATELVRLYHDRWEIELGFDELKTHMLERKECLRSKKPDGVLQEVWGLLTVYNLIRHELLEAAAEQGLRPTRASFRSSLLWFRNFWQVTAWGVSPSTIPRHLKNFRSTLDVIFVPPRRSERRYPRHVKIKMSGYKRNRGRRNSAESQAKAAK